MRGAGLLLLSFLLIAGPVFAEEQALRRDSKVYLPGDMVRIVVSAPPDTAKIIAVMPDRRRLALSYDSRNAIWQGQWEVPLNMIKGTYAADLMATDISGLTFTGQTIPFVISEPTLITLIDLVGKGEEGVVKDLTARQEAAAARQLAEEAKRKVEELTILLQNRSSLPPALRPAPRPAVKPAPRPAAKPAPKPASRISAANPSNASRETELMISARYYLARQDYPRAQAELKKLLNLRPKDGQIKELVKRVEVLSRLRR